MAGSMCAACASAHLKKDCDAQRIPLTYHPAVVPPPAIIGFCETDSAAPLLKIKPQGIKTPIHQPKPLRHPGL